MSSIEAKINVPQLDNTEQYASLVQYVTKEYNEARQSIVQRIGWGWYISPDCVKEFNALGKLLEDAGHRPDEVRYEIV